MRDYASLYSDLLRDLELYGPVDCPITSDMDRQHVACISLAASFYKKLCPGGTSPDADANALKKFKGINASVEAGAFSFAASSEVESCFYDYFKHHIRVCLEDRDDIPNFDLEFIRDNMGVGPGASQGADASSMVTKLFTGPITYYDASLIPVYRAAIAKSGLYAAAERLRYDKFGFRLSRGVKIFYAKKNAEISRVCGTESTLGMLFQKAIGAFHEFRINWYFGISLSTQPQLNSELARLGSIDGSFGTIDSVSASDSISTALIRDSYPNAFLKGVMMRSRAERAIFPDGSEEQLNMISTMGNGFTFPLQTLIFSSAVRSVYQLMNIDERGPTGIKQWGVFGDDIVVRRDAYEFLIKMLTKLGFTVNVGKSFNTGPFRESCGTDWFRGHDVRGVYLTSCESHQQVYSAFNRLARWSAVQGIPLTRVLKRLAGWARFNPVPPSESDDAGVHVPFSLTTPRLTNSYWFKYRAYVKRLKKVEVVKSKEGVDEDILQGLGFLSGVYKRREFSFKHPERTDESGFSTDSAWKSGWSASITLREKPGARTRYQIVAREIPFWDYLIPKTQDPFTDFTEKRTVLTDCCFHPWERVVAASFAFWA